MSKEEKIKILEDLKQVLEKYDVFIDFDSDEGGNEWMEFYHYDNEKTSTTYLIAIIQNFRISKEVLEQKIKQIRRGF